MCFTFSNVPCFFERYMYMYMYTCMEMNIHTHNTITHNWSCKCMCTLAHAVREYMVLMMSTAPLLWPTLYTCTCTCRYVEIHVYVSLDYPGNIDMHINIHVDTVCLTCTCICTCMSIPVIQTVSWLQGVYIVHTCTCQYDRLGKFLWLLEYPQLRIPNWGIPHIHVYVNKAIITEGKQTVYFLGWGWIQIQGL